MVQGGQGALRAYWHTLAHTYRTGGSRRGFRALRYLLHGVWHPAASRRWSVFATRNPLLKTWLDHHPRMLLKPLRPYVSRTHDFPARVEAIVGHYATLPEKVSSHALDLLLRGSAVPVAALPGKLGGSYSISLRRTEKFDKEGELILELADESHHPIYCLVFSFDPSRERLALRIGCVQGPRGNEGGRELIKSATKDLHGIRPKNLLIDALCALARVWGVGELFAVSNANRIYRSVHTVADYDTFWKELGGLRAGDGFFLLPPSTHHHDLTDVPANHRSQYRRRMQLREELERQIGEFPDRWGPRRFSAAGVSATAS